MTESESDLKELFQTCELSLTWRSKPMQLPTLLRKWKRDNWMRVLCSRTSSSFRIENYVTELPFLVQDSLVNHSAVQESDKQQKTQDTCTLGSQMELQLCVHDICSSKMLKESSQQKQETENRYLNMSSETWKAEVTRVTWGVFSASEVGAPHQRKRVFILAVSEDRWWESSEWQGWKGSKRRGEDSRGDLAKRGEEMGDTTGKRSCGRSTDENGQQSEVSRSGLGKTQYPARPREEQYEWEPKRTTITELGRGLNDPSGGQT